MSKVTLLREKPLYESKLIPKDGKFKVTGVFQRAGAKNGNTRVYSVDLWKHILGSSEIQEQLKNRQMLGELGHPDIVDTTLKDVSHIVTKLELLPNNDVYGEAEILDTPSGKILKTLYEAGVKIGISSRGYIPEGSDLVREGDHYLVPDDFCLVGFDFVLNPSTQGAYPEVSEDAKREISTIISESSNKISDSIIPVLEGMCSDRPKQSLKCNESADSVELKFTTMAEATAANKVVEKEFDGMFNSTQVAGDKVFVNFTEGQNLNVAAMKFGRKFKYSNLCLEGIKIISNGKETALEDNLFSKAVRVQASEEKAKDSKEGATEMKDSQNKEASLEEALDELRERYILAEQVINKLVKTRKEGSDKVSEIKESNSLAVRQLQSLKRKNKKLSDMLDAYDGYINQLEGKLNKALRKLHESTALTKEQELKINSIKEQKESNSSEVHTLGKAQEDFYKKQLGRLVGENKELQKKVDVISKEAEAKDSLKESIIDELMQKYNEARFVNKKVFEGKDTKDLVESLNEAKHIEDLAIKYKLTRNEAQRIYESTGSDKAFDFVMKERSTYKKNLAEYPVDALKDSKVEESKKFKDSNSKLEYIIAKTC